MTLRPIRANEVVDVEQRWLWQHRISLRGTTVLQGEGGLGKGLISAWLVAQLSRGTLPGSIPDPSNSLIISLEDTRDAVRSRLVAAGADLSRVEIDDGSELDLLADADDLAAYLREHEIRLLVVDPLHTIVKSISFDVRRSLLSLTRSSEVAVLVINHLNGSGADARGRGLGGRGLQNLSRATHVLAPHPDDGESQDGLRILAPLKMNNAPMPRSLAGRVAAVDGNPAWVWVGETDFSPNDLLARRRTRPRSSPKVDAAMDILREILVAGPVQAEDAERRAVGAGVAAGTLRRAREELRVNVQHVGFGPGSFWTWALPATMNEVEPAIAAILDESEEPSPVAQGAQTTSTTRRSAPRSRPPRPAEPSRAREPASADPEPAAPPAPERPTIDAHVGDVHIYEDDAAKRFSLLEFDDLSKPARR